MHTHLKLLQSGMFLWVLCFFLAPPVSAQTIPKEGLTEQIKQTYTLPIEYDPILCPTPLVKVAINNGKPAWFVLDTGTMLPVMLLQESAQKLKLKPTGNQSSAEGTMGQKMRWELYSGVRSLRILGKKSDEDLPLTIDQIPVLKDIHSDTFSGTYAIAGIIGMSLFTAGILECDFQQKQIVYRLSPAQDKDTPNTIRLPFSNRLLAGAATYVPVSLANDKRTEMLIDTASEYTWVPAQEVRSLRPLASEKRDLYKQKQKWSVVTHLLSPFRLSHYTVSEASVVTLEESRDYLLGMDILSRFRLIIDTPLREVRLHPVASSSELLPALRDVFLKRTDVGGVVNDLEAGSPAESAGLKKEDCIIAVDGVTLKGLPLEMMDALVMGFAGTTATLTVQRGMATNLKIQFVRRSLFSGFFRTVGLGFGTERDETKRLLIAAVGYKSPAAEAGLIIGDEVIEVNGRSARDLTDEQLGSELRKPEGSEVTLKVLRMGEKEPVTLTLKVSKIPAYEMPSH